MRIVPREEAMNSDKAKEMMERDHSGRYNTPDKSMVVLLFRVSIFEVLFSLRGRGSILRKEMTKGRTCRRA